MSDIIISSNESRPETRRKLATFLILIDVIGDADNGVLHIVLGYSSKPTTLLPLVYLVPSHKRLGDEQIRPCPPFSQA